MRDRAAELTVSSDLPEFAALALVNLQLHSRNVHRKAIDRDSSYDNTPAGYMHGMASKVLAYRI